MKKIFFLTLIALFGFALISCDNVASSSQTTIAASDTTKVFTLSELSQYTGAKGSTAYIAVEGIVYDVTDVFVNGTHQGFQLGGTDATAVFAVSPHSQALLDTLPVVGILETATSLVNTNSTITTTTTQTSPTTTTASGTQQTLPVFTLNQLSQYTGANGSTAYIAVNGVIYDVTSVFVNGTHQGLQLGGTDATAAFTSSPHSMSLLNSLPVVGTLEGFPTITIDSSTTTISQSTTNYYDDDHDEDGEDDDEIDD